VKEDKMKILVNTIAVALLMATSACSTVGGAVDGLGTDVKRGTDYLSSKINPYDKES